MKIIAFIAAILSAATVAALAWTTVPGLQKQVNEQAATIEQQGEQITEQAATIEEQGEQILTKIDKLYKHHIVISTDYSFDIICAKSTPFTNSTLASFLNGSDVPISYNGSVQPRTNYRLHGSSGANLIIYYDDIDFNVNRMTSGQSTVWGSINDTVTEL